VYKPRGNGYTQTSSAYTMRYNRARGAEKKFLDRNLSSTANMSAGVVLNSTAQGTGVNDVKQGSAGWERLGSKFSIKWIEIIWTTSIAATVKNTAAATDFNPRQVRILLVLDRQCNGALPTNGVADILNLSNTDGTGTAPSPVRAKTKVENDKRFKVLMDETVALVNSASVFDGAGNTMVLGDLKTGKYRHYFPGGLDIEMGLASGTLADIKSNNLLVCAATDTYDADQPVSVIVDTRIRFTDY